MSQLLINPKVFAELLTLAEACIDRDNHGNKDWQDDDSDSYDQCEAATRMAEIILNELEVK